jgi:DNA-binding transcriptional ArsR family regulator
MVFLKDRSALPRSATPMATQKKSTSKNEPTWTFLTNHAHVLICIAMDPKARFRDIAELVGITERAVARILSELEASGYVEHKRDGRRNIYKVRTNLPFRHPLEHHRNVGVLLEAILRGGRAKGRSDS